MRESVNTHPGVHTDKVECVYVSECRRMCVYVCEIRRRGCECISVIA